MNQASDKLFVYGSLRRGYPLHGRLKRLRARLLGVGTVQAQWREESRYPGALPSGSPSNRIEGELFLLRNPEEDLAVLDALEEVDGSRPEKSLYERQLGRVRLATGQQFLAWVYFLPRKPAMRQLVTGTYNAAGPLRPEVENESRKEQP